MQFIVVEDDPGISLALEIALSIEGHVSAAFDRAEQALTTLWNEPHTIDVVLLDLNTNGISAAEFMRQFKRLYSSQKRPLVGVLSGHDDLRDQCVRIGADFWIQKPFDLDQFIGGIKTALSGTYGACAAV